MKAIKLLLAIAVFSLSFNASASWLCVVKDATGLVFQGIGADRSAAEGIAMELCSENSEFAKKCGVDQCAEQ